MSLPFFYKEEINTATPEIILDESTSKHIVQVLRMQKGSNLQLTNGKGILITAQIIDDNRKKCTVKTIAIAPPPIIHNPICIAISLLKNTHRFEWFLEKATEIGVTEIVPLICERTEKIAFKMDRMKSILISAMLQSQQAFLPILSEPLKLTHLPIKNYTHYNKLIACCTKENEKQLITNKLISQAPNQLIIIGPEGDFTKQEIEWALKNNFTPVSLGHTRLRTETAGVVAATLLKLYFTLGKNVH